MFTKTIDGVLKVARKVQSDLDTLATQHNDKALELADKAEVLLTESAEENTQAKRARDLAAKWADLVV